MLHGVVSSGSLYKSALRTYYINQKQKGRGLIYATILIPWKAMKRFYETR
jgi:hypothetical protein